LLNFTAQITGTKFDFPPSWYKLQKGSIELESFIKEINTNNNKLIMKNLHFILWWTRFILVWKADDWYDIYLVVSSAGSHFDGWGGDEDY